MPVDATSAEKGGEEKWVEDPETGEWYDENAGWEGDAAAVGGEEAVAAEEGAEEENREWTAEEVAAWEAEQA